MGRNQPNTARNMLAAFVVIGGVIMLQVIKDGLGGSLIGVLLLMFACLVGYRVFESLQGKKTPPAKPIKKR